VVHTTDVDGMLDSMTPQQFQEWCAFDRVDPIGNQGLCDTIANFAVVVCNGLGAEINQGDLMAWVKPWGTSKTSGRAISPNQAAAMVKGMFGNGSTR